MARLVAVLVVLVAAVVWALFLRAAGFFFATLRVVFLAVALVVVFFAIVLRATFFLVVGFLAALRVVAFLAGFLLAGFLLTTAIVCSFSKRLMISVSTFVFAHTFE